MQGAKTTLIIYNATHCKEIVNPNIEECCSLSVETQVNWLHIAGAAQRNLLDKLAETYHIHPLVVEDILHTRQRPKVESYGDYLYITLRLFKENNMKLTSQQVSFVLKNNLLISVIEADTPVFDEVRNRLFKNNNLIRQRGEDFLLYSLLDAIIDSYFDVLEDFSSDIETLEENIIAQASKQHLVALQNIKRSLIFFRKYTTPVRELLSNLDRNNIDFFEAENRPYLRDLLDHIFRVNDSVETYRDILTSLMDLYHSMLSHRMNEVMKTLTVISSFFIPLTFIVGIYGMNFDVMPELRWKYGYYAVWLFMISLSLTLFIVFKKKKWF
ncbi:MAG: magnesium/cobalt transporter CorA [Chitinophagales bacterium]|nr:magnesium/cobalt transporter CorA [Chitinophagales bacterium]MDW8274421.1 magnesium/cobalt transporter CorA [Chitinophagales bacterium]